MLGPRRTMRAMLILVGSAAVAAVLPAVASTASAATGTSTSYAYVSASRQSSAVYINGLVKQNSATGILRSPRRTIYLQRNLDGTWQTMLTRVTDWYGVFTVGFISLPGRQYRYVVTASGSARATTSAAVTTTTFVPTAAGTRIVTEARKYVGLHNPGYVYGGTSPTTGFDCSGYTQYVYRVTTVASLPRTAEQQRHAVRIIPASQARAGDLVFYMSGSSAYHEAIYAGNGMQYAAATPQDGIRYQGVWSSDVQYGTTWH
ncbi:MAG: hypothetical protein DLM57_10120 [Pseudonocardiales bacterium]|nr:MAG: hypothetical protein DLM57_10120 [Pseudonocardiales bacterium]